MPKSKAEKAAYDKWYQETVRKPKVQAAKEEKARREAEEQRLAEEASRLAEETAEAKRLKRNEQSKLRMRRHREKEKLKKMQQQQQLQASRDNATMGDSKPPAVDRTDSRQDGGSDTAVRDHSQGQVRDELRGARRHPSMGQFQINETRDIYVFFRLYFAREPSQVELEHFQRDLELRQERLMRVMQHTQHLHDQQHATEQALNAAPRELIASTANLHNDQREGMNNLLRQLGFPTMEASTGSKKQRRNSI